VWFAQGASVDPTPDPRAGEAATEVGEEQMPRKAESLRIPSPEPPSYDTDAANRLIDEAFESQGWLVVEDGEVKHDLTKLRHAMFVAFTSNHVVTSVAASNRRAFNERVAEAAVTKYRLYIELFPRGPAAEHAPRTEEEQAAKEQLAKYIWSQSSATNRKGWLQTALAESGLVVLETKVFSTDPGVPPEPGRYVTNVDHAMLDFLEHKVFGDVRKKLGEADAWLATFYARNPDIALPAARKARAALRAAVESVIHANPAYVRETLALTSGDDEDAAES